MNFFQGKEEQHGYNTVQCSSTAAHVNQYQIEGKREHIDKTATKQAQDQRQIDSKKKRTDLLNSDVESMLDNDFSSYKDQGETIRDRSSPPKSIFPWKTIARHKRLERYRHT